MPDKKKWSIQNISFQWRGRTKDGVSRWWGAEKGPPEWFNRIFLAWGAIAGTGGVVASLAYLITHNPGLAPLIIVGFTHGLAGGITGLWARKMRLNIAQLKSAEELAEEFGSTPEVVKRLAEEHSIRARINLNDTNLYNPKEFYASQILLRAASAPIDPELLLRAAEPTAPQAAPDTLLRPMEDKPETQTPAQPLISEQSSSSIDLSRYRSEQNEETQTITQKNG
jgi:hypothetical protein